MKYVFVIIILSMILITGCTVKDCGTNIFCFKEAAKYCSRASVNIIDEGNNIRLTSRGEWNGKCEVSLKIEAISNELSMQNPTLARTAIGKTLNCAVPVEVVEYNRDQYINEILNLEDKFNQYCSGPIKDALQGPLKEFIKEKIKIN